MSAPEERGALPSRPSLYTCAVSVRHAEPEGPWCRDYAAPPDRTGPRPKKRTARRGWAQVRDELTEVLGPLLVDPDAASAAEELHLRVSLMDPPVRHRSIHRVVRGLPLENEARARALARCLVRTGRSHPAVCVGLALLARVGEVEDVPYLVTLGLLRDLAGPVVHALDTLDRPAAALIALRCQEAKPELRGLVAALDAGDEVAVRERLVALPSTIAPDVARRVAEAARVGRLLRPDVPRTQRGELTARIGWLLFRMTTQRDYTSEILLYEDAVRAYETFARGASHLEPTLDHYGLVLSAVQELRSGPGRLHDWGLPGLPGLAGRREAVIAALVAVLDRAEWRAVLERDGADAGARRRTAWARRARAQVARDPAGPAEGLRIEVAERDPVDPDTVEARIVVDGRPLVPEVFGRGPAHSPEWLLDSGRLRATDEPREVQLAEAYCAEGCCGALYVTIRRDGGEVVWSDWRCPAPPPSPLPSPLHVREIPELRFDAAAYDTEIARAENDHTWTWPARKAARLIAAGLRDRPELLTRWGAELSWAGTSFRDPDRTVVYLRYAGEDGPPTYVEWGIPEDGTPPEERAADALNRLATADPRTYEA